MSYIALYRKYRSQSFGELMGQEQVTRTLQNAIKTGRIAHAYLFHGARGCGKTSTARLLARALNCVAQDGPTPEPCGVCRLCVSIRDGSCMDVIEMDAASETGIDDVREKIIENVQYAPAEARYKVYIIDEVHDLSAKAFDALLKTLEEPPPHVVFILATTEWHKVPITIRSRCQPFQFKRGTLHDLGASIERVIGLEGYTTDAEAIQSIARSAEGSWRDALSLLEQVMAYSDGHIAAETVQRAIGTVGSETLARVTATLAEGRWDATLAVAAELIESGTDVRQLLTALSGHLHDIMLISAGATQAAMTELGADRYALLAPQATLYDPPTLLAMMGVLSNAERELRFTNQHRALLETTLLRLMPGMQGTGNREQGTGKTAPVPRPMSETQRPPLSAAPTVIPKPAPPTPPTYATFQAEEAETFAEAEPDDEPIETAVFAPPITAAPVTVSPLASAPVPVPQSVADDDSSPAGESRFADAVTIDVLRRAWTRILKLFQKASPQGYPFLEKAEVTALESNFIVLTFRDSFARDRIQNNEKGRVKVEKTINEALNTDGYKIRCIMADEGDALPVTMAKPAETGNAPPPPPAVMTLMDAPEPIASSAPSRIMDFDTSAPPPSSYQNSSAANGGNGSHSGETQRAAPASAAAPPAPHTVSAPNTGMLEATLDVFGGQVVATEPL